MRERRAIAHQAERGKGLEEAELALVDANRVVGADVERAHFDVLHAAAKQRLRRPLAREGDALRADEAVVLVLDLKQVRVQLPPFCSTPRDWYSGCGVEIRRDRSRTYSSSELTET